MEQKPIEGFEPDRLDILAGVMQGTATVKTKMAVRPVLLRLPIHVVAELTAIADQAGKSRNYVAGQLLAAAMEQLGSRLDPNKHDAVLRDASIHLASLIEAGETEES